MIHDEDIREPLFDFLEEKYGKIRIIEEKTIGRSRADLLMVMPDCIVGIEIKSDADSYTRLPSQIKSYDQYFDANILVVGSTHAMHAAEHIPEWWGIISAELDGDRMDFYVIREMSPNPNLDPEKKIKILWRPEIAHIQEINHLPAYKNKGKEYVRKVVVNRVPEAVLNRQISEELFERDYTAIAETVAAYRRKSSKEAGAKTKSVRRRRIK